MLKLMVQTLPSLPRYVRDSQGVDPLDQPGRGKGSLITADDPSASGVSWPNQALDPVYSWNNKRAADGSNVDLVSAEPTIQEGRDFLNNTASRVTNRTFIPPAR